MSFDRIVGRAQNTKCNGCGKIVSRIVEKRLGTRNLQPEASVSSKPFYCSPKCEAEAKAAEDTGPLSGFDQAPGRKYGFHRNGRR